MENLKSCPFCGGDAFLRKLYTNWFVDAKHGTNCVLANMCVPHDTPWVTMEAAIAAWNNRYTDSITIKCESYKLPPQDVELILNKMNQNGSIGGN